MYQLDPKNYGSLSINEDDLTIVDFEIAPDYVNLKFDLMDDQNFERPAEEYIHVDLNPADGSKPFVIVACNKTNNPVTIDVLNPSRLQFTCNYIAYDLLFAMTYDKIQGQTVALVINFLNLIYLIFLNFDIHY